MVKDYTMQVVEVIYGDFKANEGIPFRMSEIVDAYDSEGFANEALKQFCCAAKVMVVETHSAPGGQERKTYRTVCLPREGRNVLKERIMAILPTRRDLFEWCVDYHNQLSAKLGLKSVSLDELEELYIKTIDSYNL